MTPKDKAFARRRSFGFVASLLLVVSAAVGISVIPSASNAQGSIVLSALSTEPAADFIALPLTNSNTITPLVMLGLAIDEKAFRRAYDDLADLDGDGAIDPSYKNSIVYTGYFDTDRCYTYSADRFKASAIANEHRCSGAWSGNFLNWLTMTRVDLIRHALYGGLRSVDTANLTILERAHVPEDSHAWVKIYRGADLDDFTPMALPASGAMSFCNATRETVSVTFSENSTRPPSLRIAAGAFPLWSAIEAYQCDGENGNPRPGTPGNDDSRITDLNVRVEVCADVAPLRESFCQPYGENSFKPVGLLQKYGEDGNVRFGLISRSYSRPRSGGQLRRNIGQIARNGNNPAECAAGDEIRLSTGQFCSSSSGSGSIIASISAMKIAQYRYARGGAEIPRHDDCDRVDQFTRAADGNGISSPGPAGGRRCNSYGNPVAEIYSEALRYISGAVPTAAYSATDLSPLRALDRATSPTAWTDPLAELGECADCSLIMISSGVNSFDADELPNIGGAGLSSADIAAQTDAIGIAEGLNGAAMAARIQNSTPSSTDRSLDAAVCGPLSISNLSQVRGSCPANPTRDSGFHVAGAAYLGHTRDLRPSLAGRQSARTYAINFDDAIPSIPVPMPNGRVITITPTCQSIARAADNSLRQCSFAAAVPGPITANNGITYGRNISPTGRSGSVFVAWDDAPYGQTQENNVSQMISWCVGSECEPQGAAGTAGNTCFRTDSTSAADCDGGVLRAVGADELVVRVELLSGFASEPERLGFAIMGASNAAENRTYNLLNRRVINLPGAINDLNLLRDNQPPLSQWNPAAAVRSFRAGDSGVIRLPDPLELAAKYGSFDFVSGTTNPQPEPSTVAGVGCNATSWDRVNNATGVPPADCIADHYHGLQHPGLIASRPGAIGRLERIIQDVITRSGTSQSIRAGVQSGFAQAAGAAYQTFYESETTDAAGRRVVWVGNVQALFVDRDGRLREDGSTRDGVLDESDYAGHPVVELAFDTASRQTRFRRYSANPADDPDAFEVINDIRQLRTFWNARQQLSALGSVDTQRPYAAAATSGRHILTFADLDLDGKASASEVVPFTPASFGADRFGVLNVGSTAQASALVNWVRGVDTAGLRSRQLARDGGSPVTERLGDIVNSQPLVVAAPAEAYDLLYSDASYAEFFRRYRDRRQVIYVGANDGMLHAFNGGFRRADGSGYSESSGAATSHPLGSELWAYVPFNLLPHLGFLAAPGYVHQWTMDGSPRAFDVRAFPADATHPDGWGTLLVVGMRLGGARVTIEEVGSGDDNRAAFAAYASGLGGRDEFVSRSAYVIFDVTDPEQPPRLIAEFSDPRRALGLTTSRPAVAAFVTPAAGGVARSDAWYLLFGSGPNSLTQAVSSRRARLFALDLGRLLDPSLSMAAAIRSHAADGSGDDDDDDATSFADDGFVGDPVAVDWDLNYRTDALYFGTSSGLNPDTSTGKLFKIDFNPTPSTPGAEIAEPASWPAPTVVLDTQRPVLNAPSVTQDERGNRWVLAGTGRFLSQADRPSPGRQALFGVIDRIVGGAGTAPVLSTLTETTAAVVSPSGTITGLGGIATEAALVEAIRGIPGPGGSLGSGGWRYELGTSSASNGAERTTANTALLDSILFATAYTPSEALCADQGSSRLYAVNFLTGAARATRPALSRIVNNGAGDVVETLSRLDLGQGLAGAPNLFVNNATVGGRGTYTINLPTSTGAIAQPRADDTGRIRSGEIDWRETHPGSSP